jgi:hypothetical protein
VVVQGIEGRTGSRIGVLMRPEYHYAGLQMAQATGP